MKSIMLTCAVALISALNANANLGETKGQSINHYGRIISTNERGISMWNVKGYWIAEWFNENGYAESIWYYKKSGGISQRESDAFQHVNLPSTALDQGWLEQELRAVPDQNSRVWLTPDGVWYFESGSLKMGKYYYACIVIGTARANRIIISGEKQQKQQPPTDTQNSDSLPL